MHGQPPGIRREDGSTEPGAPADRRSGGATDVRAPAAARRGGGAGVARKPGPEAGRRGPGSRGTGQAPERTRGSSDGSQGGASLPASGGGEVRLSKRMAELGLCSRREADAWIERGWVRVDGVPVTVLGSKVLPHQRVTVERAAQAEQARRVTVLLNKPIGFVSGQAEDGYRPAATLVTRDSQWDQDASGIAFQPVHLRGLAPAGRLDIDSTGLLVLTQDGRVARQLIGAGSGIEKEYLVRVAGSLDARGLARLRHGLSLDGVPLQAARVEWLNEDQLRFVLVEGRKRQIRRMCDLVGLRVLGLKRVRIGKVVLGRLPPGRWRYLAPDERF